MSLLNKTVMAVTQMTREVFHSESLATSMRNGSMSTFTLTMVSSMEVTTTVKAAMKNAKDVEDDEL
jgi:hypothetical protein